MQSDFNGLITTTLTAYPDLQPLGQRLREIAKANWTDYDAWADDEIALFSRRDGDDWAVLPEVREIGERAHEIGGRPAMRAVSYGTFMPAQTWMDTCAVSELNHAWNGVGNWQA